MSDYSETFTKVDGNTIEASDFETEFQAIETAIATKSNKASSAGDITIGGAAAKGIVILDNPEQLLTINLIGDIGTSTVFTSSSGFASTTLSTASATAAIIRVFTRLSWSSDADVWAYFSLRKAGESDIAGIGGTTIAGQRDTHASASGTSQAYIIGEGTVPLNASSDFEYAFSFDSSANLAATGGGIYLIGYYV